MVGEGIRQKMWAVRGKEEKTRANLDWAAEQEGERQGLVQTARTGRECLSLCASTCAQNHSIQPPGSLAPCGNPPSTGDWRLVRAVPD